MQHQKNTRVWLVVRRRFHRDTKSGVALRLRAPNKRMSQNPKSSRGVTPGRTHSSHGCGVWGEGEGRACVAREVNVEREEVWASGSPARVCKAIGALLGGCGCEATAASTTSLSFLSSAGAIISAIPFCATAARSASFGHKPNPKQVIYFLDLSVHFGSCTSSPPPKEQPRKRPREVCKRDS